MEKGITPIIGIVVLLLITVALVGSAYTFLFGVAETSTEKTIKIAPASENENSVVVQNLGRETIQPEDLRITVNGKEATLINPQPISSGSSLLVRFNSPVAGKKLNVRIISPTNSVSYFVDVSSTGSPNETCTDSVQNQNEIGIDCGGVCITGNEAICDDSIDNDNDCFVDMTDTDCLPGSNTVLHFTMDKIIGNMIEDLSGNENNGTLFGPDCKVPGISRKGCYFNGSTYIKTSPSDSLNLGGGNVSIAAWVKFNKLESSYDGIYNYGGIGGITNWYTLYLSNLNTTHMRISSRTLNGNLNFETGKWYFLVGTFDNNTNTITLYVNGKQDKSIVISSPSWSQATAQNASLGTSRYNNNEFINATIDEVVVWNKTLTASEIQQLYSSKKRDIGLWAMENFDTLPYFKNGVQVLQYSGYDRTGGNSDGFTGRYSYLYMEGSKYIIFDETGPGGVYNIWMTGTQLNDSGYIMFYFDNESIPRINMTVGDFFDGSVGAPFISPLTGRISQSRYSYVPLLFEKRLKIVMTQQPYFYHFTYHRYADPAGIDTFTGTENYTGIIDTWNNKGSHPAGDEGTQIASGNTGQISPGSAYTLLDYSGTNYNYISTVKIDPSPNDDATLENVWIRMYWDNETSPSVEAPVGEFFGSGIGEVDTGSLAFGMNTTGYYYSFFPMPFLGSAKIEIFNNGTSLASVNYTIKAKKDPAMIVGFNAGYFHARYSKEFPTTENKDYIFLNTTGRGHYVGVVHTMRGLSTSADEPTTNYRRRYLEGDERFFIDGKLSPSMYGTGTEDYFLGAYYFGGTPYDTPMHGVHHEFDADSLGRYDYNPYRLQLNDFIPFTNYVFLGIEHGAANEGPAGGGCAGSTWKNCNGNYSSVAFYYAISANKSALTDEVDVGNTASENAHSYSVGGGQFVSTQTFEYPGYDIDTPLSVSDEGRVTSGFNTTFTASINSNNNGVTLRRRLDYNQSNQIANVYVDGDSVGVWYTAGMHDVYNPINNNIRWLDSDFQIPQEFTENKSSITVTIEGSNWNEFYYWVYSNAAQ